MKEWEQFVSGDKHISEITTKEILAWMSDATMPIIIHTALAREIFKRKGLT